MTDPKEDSNPAVISVAANPYIPAGASSTTIYFFSRQLASFDYQRVTVTASFGGVSIARQVNVFAIPLKSFTVGINTLHNGQTTTGTVTLNIPAPRLPVVVAIATSSNALVIPSTVTIPAGSASATFSISATPVTKPTVVHLSAAVSGTVQSQTITVEP